MAILSNGKFYGFLCSAKETGQRLANGAKEYVEDFISGFAGHGWKIWEYVKGKWMLEIDSIRVRGQFTVFEMLVSKIRAIIGAQAITQGCGKIKKVELSEDRTAFLITLEDADMSFMEHDFIRCQEFTGSQKVYHVEIESVVDGVIRIPLSEFDMDEGGVVLNPPAAGDDIVQFGNSSHDEKYVGRHSAIYMHADEGLPPAIDVLDEIYSKENWSDCLKVRVGGEIPGSGGLKGLYCVNGVIKGVDESGHTVYCLYPDGTAELGDSSALFRPDKSGYIAGGSIAWEWNEEKKKYVVSMDDVQVEWTNLKDSLGWINEWTEKGTTIGDKFVAAPTGFFGKQDKDEKLTGILMGEGVKVKSKNENGEIMEELRTGIFALVDDKIVFELDPVAEKYAFKGTVESDTGRIGGFNIKTYGLQNVEGRDCYVSMTNKTQIGYENGKEIYSERTATIGNSLSAIFGIKEVARMSYTGKEYDEHSVLSLIATGSTQKYRVFGGYANLCINATGGCNWNMNSGDHWCMPGVLGIVRFSCTYANYTYTYKISTIWGNGIPNASGYINDPNESSRVIIVNIKMGHKDYSVIGQVVGATAKEGYWDMNAHTEFINESSFGISVWNNNKKYLPSVLDMFIIGRPYIDA